MSDTSNADAISQTQTQPPQPDTQPIAAKAPKSKKSDSVTFKSTQQEVTEYEVMGFRGQRGADNALYWDVPADLVQRFKRHVFVVQGRIVEAK